MAEVAVFDIEIQGALTKLAQLRNELNTVKETQKTLVEEVKKGNEDATKSYELNAAVIKNLEQEQRTLQRTVQGALATQKANTDQINFNNNSLQQNRDLLKQLTAQYINLKNPSAEATNQIKRLSDTLKSQEAAIGDTRRSVGNYAEAIKGALGDLRLFGVNLGQVGNTLKDSANGFRSAGGGLKGFGTALAGLGLPVVTLAMGALSKAFEQFKPLADAVETATAQTDAAFRALVSGRSIGDATEAAAKYIETLRELEDTQLIFNARVEASNGLIEEYILKSKNQGISDQQRIKFLEQANLVEENLFKDKQERLLTEIVALENKFKLEASLNDKQLVQLRDGTYEAKKELRERLVNTFNLNEEEVNSYFEKLVKLEQIENDSINLQQKIANRRIKLEEDIKNENEKATEKQKQELEKQKQEQEKYLQTIDNLTSEFLLTEREKIQASFEKKLNQIKGNGKKEIELRIAILEAEQKALEEFDLKIAKSNQQKAIEEFTKGVEKELELLDLKQEERRTFLIQSGLTETEITEKFRKERQDVIDKYAQQEIDANLKKAKESLEIEKEYTKESIDLGKFLLEAEAQIQQNRFDIAANVSNILGTLAGDNEVLATLSLLVAKSAAIADIVITTQKSNAIAKANAATVPVVIPGTLIPNPAFPIAQTTAASLIASNNIAAGVAIAAIGTQAIKQGIQINKQKEAPQFEDGGEIAIQGKPHSQGGENVYVGNRLVANVEGGEGLFVMKKNAYQSLAKYSAINEAFGGKSWLNGSSKYLADGGAINTTLPIIESRNKVNSAIEQNRLLAKAIEKIPAPQLSIVEFEKKTRTKNKSVRVSEL